MNRKIFALALALACTTGSASAFSLSDFFNFSFFRKAPESTPVVSNGQGGCTPVAGHGEPDHGPACKF